MERTACDWNSGTHIPELALRETIAKNWPLSFLVSLDYTFLVNFLELKLLDAQQLEVPFSSAQSKWSFTELSSRMGITRMPKVLHKDDCVLEENLVWILHGGIFYLLQSLHQELGGCYFLGSYRHIPSYLLCRYLLLTRHHTLKYVFRPERSIRACFHVFFLATIWWNPTDVSLWITLSKMIHVDDRQGQTHTSQWQTQRDMG